MTTNPFLRSAEHCMGNVVEAPASALSKVCSCCWASRSARLGKELHKLMGESGGESLPGNLNVTYLGIVRHG